MKVLRIIASMDPRSGGPCQGIRNSAGALADVGISTEAVCTDDPKASFIGQDSFPVHGLGPTSNAWGYSAKLLPWLSANLSRFDAIISHGLWLHPTLGAMQAMKSHIKQSNGNSPRWFIMPHGMLDPYFQKTQDRKLKALRNEVYWKLVESKVIKAADGLLFTTEEELLLARTTFSNYSPQKELNVGYGIQAPPPFDATMSTAFYKRCNIRSDHSYLLFLGRIHPKKGIDELMAAYQELLDMYPIRQIPSLVVAGPTSASYAEKLIQGVQQDTRLNGKVFFPGMLNDAAKWGAFYHAEAFVLPSHQENFGIAVAEALACKKPVLISNKINIWREISAGHAGLIENDDTDGTFKLLDTWIALSNPEKELMGQNAYEVYQKNYTVSENIKKLAKVLAGNYAMN